MGAQNNAYVTALQLEKVLKNLSFLFDQDANQLYTRIQKKTDLQKVSKRAMKIPLAITAGGKFKAFNSDGGVMGRGSGIDTQTATLTTCDFLFATELTVQAKVATDSNEKAITSAATLAAKGALKQFKMGMDQLIFGDGSGTLSTVVNVGGTSLQVENANQFYDNQDIDIWSSLGGTFRGTVTISTVDPNNQTINLTAAPPATTADGDLLLVNGSAGSAASSILGLYYHHSNSNTRTWMNLQASQFPGKLITPHVAAGGNLTVAQARTAKQLMRRALGTDSPDLDSFVWVMGTEQEASWESLSLTIQQIQRTQLGKSGQDILTKNAPTTMAGQDIIVSNHGNRTRIDGLCLKHWGRAVTQEMNVFKVGNDTVFTPYDSATGSPVASELSYLWTSQNVYMDNPQAGVYIDGLTLPAAYQQLA